MSEMEGLALDPWPCMAEMCGGKTLIWCAHKYTSLRLCHWHREGLIMSPFYSVAELPKVSCYV